MAKAIAVLTRLGEPEVGGVISFTQKTEDTPTAIVGEVRGLKPKETFGISIQIFGDLSEGFGSMGGHFNPFGRNHGEPGDEERHVGSLGNITADEKGVAKFEITDKLVKLIGPYVRIHFHCCTCLASVPSPHAIVAGACEKLAWNWHRHRDAITSDPELTRAVCAFMCLLWCL